MESVGAVAAAIVVFGAGLLVARAAARSMFGWRQRRHDELERRGTIYMSDMVFRLALLPVWAGGAIAALSLLPAAAWIATDDGEAAGIALRLLIVGLCIALLGVLVALVGDRAVVLEADRLTRVGPFRERSIQFNDITGLQESRGLPAVTVRSEQSSIRISKSLAGFDDLFNQLAPYAVISRDSATAPIKSSQQPTVLADGIGLRYSVPRRTFVTTFGLMGATFVFLVSWPWFVVEGDHVIRDSFAFVGIGLLLWVAIVFAVSSENLSPGQPIELELRRDHVAWRNLRGGWHERPRHELVSASVETVIIYVKGQPGHRYPLRLRFIDDEVLEVGDFRAKHFTSSTHLIGLEARRLYMSVDDRQIIERDEAKEQARQGQQCEAVGDLRSAVDHYRKSIALWPDESGRALYRHVGDLLHTIASSTQGSGAGHRREVARVRTAAVGHYRAHLDFFPRDADAWQALASALDGALRSDLKDEAVSSAEQLLLSGRHEPTTHLRMAAGGDA